MKKALFVILIAMCLILSSCGMSNNMSCANMLSSLIKVSGEDIEGNGIVYFDDVEEGEIGYLSREDKVLLYGENRVCQLFDGNKIEDYAMFFSTSNGYTENSGDVFSSNLPYLKSVESSWDKNVSSYQRTKDFKVG